MVSKVRVKKYKLERPMFVYVKGLTVKFENDRIESLGNGTVMIKAGNCSDGCSPKYDLPIIGIVGAWDGPKTYNQWQRKHLPITHDAFFAHDVLLEHRKELGIQALECHQVFEALINFTSWSLAPVYVWAVYTFGPE